MYGDRLVLSEFHRIQAKRLFNVILDRLNTTDPLSVSIGGESGSGKTGVAQVVSEVLSHKGIPNIILGLDDYFYLPPADTMEKRLEDINVVGPQEVNLDLLANHVKQLKDDPMAMFIKPLMNFEENCLEYEELSPGPVRVILVEGTYVTTLPHIDLRVFMGSSYEETKHYRKKRSRDPMSEFIEQVLEIEHQIIISQRSYADIVLDEEYIAKTG
jgi:uridine kinase